MKQWSANEFRKKLTGFFIELPEDGRHTMVSRYGIASLYIAVAFAIRWSLTPLLGYQAPFILFIPVILLIAWRTGLGPALAASLGTFLLVNYFIVYPPDQWNPLDAYEIASAATYIVSALAVVGWANALRTERQRVIAKSEESTEQARRLQQELKQRRIAEDRLHEREERLRAIMENSPAMIFLKDTEGRYLLANRQFEKIARRPVAEIVGRTDTELFTEEQATAFSANDREVMEAGRPLEFEEVAWHPNGPHTSIVQKFPLRDPSGRVYAIGGIATDITDRKQWEQAVQESEEKYRSLYRNTPVMMHSIDRAGRLLNVSNFWLDTLGYKREEVIGRHSTEFLTKESRKYAREVVLPNYFKSGICVDVPYQMVKKNGEIIDVLISGIAEKNSSGAVVRSLAVIIDVTAQKRAEAALRASENRYRRLIELLPVAVCTTDAEGRITLCNQHAIELLGRQPEIGKDLRCGSYRLYNSNGSPLSDEQNPMRMALRERRSVRGREVIIERPDGSRSYVLPIPEPLYDAEGKFIGIINVLVDLTERRRAEDALQQARNALAAHAQELELRVAQRTSDLEKSLKDMETFCYTIAHDLRAPLRAMTGFSNALIEDHAPQMEESARTYCERINLAVNRMDALIGDLLLYGRLTHVELPSRSVDLGIEVEKVLRHSAYEIEQRHADIDVDKPLPKVVGDAPVIDQVLENLITNAIKFVPADRHPQIHIYAEHHAETVRLCIEDNGIGIPNEYRDRIFKPFERLHSGAYPGTGIGLAIVQRGVEKMGGHVGVESAPHQGSRFWVELPEESNRRS